MENKTEKQERKIGVPESEYREMRRALHRQRRTKIILEQLWNIWKKVKV